MTVSLLLTVCIVLRPLSMITSDRPMRTAITGPYLQLHCHKVFGGSVPRKGAAPRTGIPLGPLGNLAGR